MKKLLLVCLFCTAFYGAGGNSEPAKDPLVGINYRTTFNLAGVYKKFSDVVEQLGVADNIAARSKAGSDGYALVATDEAVFNQRRFDAFQKACLDHLRKQRLWTLSYLGRESITLLALMVGATAYVWKLSAVVHLAAVLPYLRFYLIVCGLCVILFAQALIWLALHLIL